jgi:hypothetical protein
MSKTTDFKFDDIYEVFLSKYPDTEITYELFFFILKEFNRKLVGALLDGKIIKMGNNLGQLKVSRVQRNHEKPTINWAETKKLQLETGDMEAKVYYTDDFYYRFKWLKGRVPNITVYKWYGTKGMRKRLTRVLNTDPLAKLNFK